MSKSENVDPYSPFRRKATYPRIFPLLFCDSEPLRLFCKPLLSTFTFAILNEVTSSENTFLYRSVINILSGTSSTPHFLWAYWSPHSEGRMTIHCCTLFSVSHWLCIQGLYIEYPVEKLNVFNSRRNKIDHPVTKTAMLVSLIKIFYL